MMKASSQVLDRLMTVLRERAVALTREDVGWAFESPKTRDSVDEWAGKHLGQETLLSTEELKLYARVYAMSAMYHGHVLTKHEDI